MTTPSDPISAAIAMVRRWRRERPRLDQLEAEIAAQLPPEALPGVRSRVHAVVREHGRIEALLQHFAHRPPPEELGAVLALGLAETIERIPENPAPVIHFWVNAARSVAAEPQARFANALLRRAAARLSDDRTKADWPLATLPAWWRERWARHYDPEAIRAFATAVSGPPPSPTVRVLRPDDPALPPLPAPDHPHPYASLPKGAPLAEWYRRGSAIAQDPAQRHPVAWITAAAPRRVLDLCAAPGGKAIALAAALGPGCAVLANDRPGPRCEKMREDLRQLPFPGLAVSAEDATGTLPPEWSEGFDAVLVDVPCSNSGTFRRQPDVKWRQTPAGLQELSALQAGLLAAGSRCVAPGGCLVYSTCSIDPEENLGIVTAFLGSAAGGLFVLRAQSIELPWVHGFDGAGAFLLARI